MNNEFEEKTIEFSFAKLIIRKIRVGDDLAVIVGGGDRPHIGCTVISIPRKSLSGDGTISCTSSVINVTGHKDDELLKLISEKLCKTYNCIVTCTGGFHIDDISPEQIKELMATVWEMEV